MLQERIQLLKIVVLWCCLPLTGHAESVLQLSLLLNVDGVLTTHVGHDVTAVADGKLLHGSLYGVAGRVTASTSPQHSTQHTHRYVCHCSFAPDCGICEMLQ